jgi:hypothetical protein
MPTKTRTLDFSNLRPSDPEPPTPKPPKAIPEGIYRVKAIACADKTSRLGTEYCQFELRIIDKDYQSVHKDFRLWIVIPWRKEFWWRWRDFIQTTTGERPQGEHTFNPNELLLRPFLVNVKNHLFNGEWHSSVKNFTAE